MLNFTERDRRYKLVREQMAAQRLEAMIVICDAQIEKKGFLKYLTNYRNTLYNLVAIFPLAGEPKLLVPSPVQKFWAAKLSWIPDVLEQKPSLNEVLVKCLVERGFSQARVGLASAKIMTADTYNYLIGALPEMTIVNADSIIAELRKIKSSAEQELVRKTAQIAKYSFDVLGEILKPGITELDVVAQVDPRLTVAGAQDIFHLICSGKGELMPFLPKDRVIRAGDSVIFNTELSGPGGYWIQMIRTAFVGKPTGEVAGMYDTLLEINHKLPDLLRPGVKAGDIAKLVIDFTHDAGFEVGVNFGHCLGLDVVEAPLISTIETEVLKAGMVIIVHPQLVHSNKLDTVWYGDTYLIKEEGPAEILTDWDPDKLKLNF
jgi:Xaa-Pro aminopeptidase